MCDKSEIKEVTDKTKLMEATDDNRYLCYSATTSAQVSREKSSNNRDQNDSKIYFFPKFYRFGSSKSDYAISSRQLPTRYVVHRLSGMLSALYELGETSKSNENFKGVPNKYLCDDQTSISDECRCALCTRANDRKFLVKDAIYSQWSRSSYFSDIGALCGTCMGHPIINGTCLKIADQKALFGSSSNTLHSFTAANCSVLSSRETVPEKFCRICHSFENSENPLISPCRCTGSLKYVHMSCLLHWLTICAHKLKRPAICELCLYKYRRRHTIAWQNLRLPSISRRDLRYLISFAMAVVMMFITATISFICFCIERNMDVDTKTNSPGINTKENDEWETLLSSSIFLSAFLFFVALFVAMYAHIKTSISLVSYTYHCWATNQNWTVEEYRPSRDERYRHKLEQLRRRLNGGVAPNSGTEGGTSGGDGGYGGGEGGGRNSAYSPGATFLRSSSILSSPSVEATISVSGSAVVHGASIISNADRSFTPFTTSTTAATPAIR